MNVISVRVNDDEMAMLQHASRLYAGKIFSMMKKIVFDKLEDDYDMQAVLEYEEKKKSGKLEARSVQDVCKDMGIDFDAL